MGGGGAIALLAPPCGTATTYTHKPQTPHIHVHTHTHTQTHIQMHTYIYTHKYTHKCTHTCTHKHTPHTHTQRTHTKKRVHTHTHTYIPVPKYRKLGLWAKKRKKEKEKRIVMKKSHHTSTPNQSIFDRRLYLTVSINRTTECAISEHLVFKEKK